MSTSVLRNCIFWNNVNDQISTRWDQVTTTYNCIQNGWPGYGNKQWDPLFADSASGDYHLLSQVGRWNPDIQTWVTDAVTSPSIDMGDPTTAIGTELWPHGKRVNMGAYGANVEASMSLSTVGNIADLNNNDAVGVDDFGQFADNWQKQECLLNSDMDRNGVVDNTDLNILLNSWMWVE